MKAITTHSENETKELAKKIAQKIKHGVIALTGELGAGKTTFVQGFAKGMGIKEKIISPTFVLIREHKIPNSTKIFYHIDLYRLEDKSAIDNIGLDDLFSNPNAIVVIEWAEKLENLPENTTNIKIEIIQSNKRRLEIRNFPSCFYL